jgi:hypothetical protein
MAKTLEAPEDLKLSKAEERKVNKLKDVMAEFSDIEAEEDVINQIRGALQKLGRAGRIALMDEPLVQKAFEDNTAENNATLKPGQPIPGGPSYDPANPDPRAVWGKKKATWDDLVAESKGVIVEDYDPRPEYAHPFTFRTVNINLRPGPVNRVPQVVVDYLTERRLDAIRDAEEERRIIAANIGGYTAEYNRGGGAPESIEAEAARTGQSLEPVE